MDLNALLHASVQAGASDVHLKLGKPPMVRRDGIVGPLEGWAPLDERDLEAALDVVTRTAPAKRDWFHETGDLDIAYEDEVDAAIAALTSIIEPVMMIGVGCMVGVIIISMYLPMFKMLTLIK